MSAEVKILDGNTFVVSDEAGDIEASLTDPTGLFSFDTRFLSKWVLTIDGQRLNPLSVDDLQYFETRFFLVGPTVLASQTCGLYRLYDAAGRQVHGSLRRCLALSFLRLKRCISPFGGAKRCQKVTAARYGSLPPNIRMLSGPSGACYQ